MSKERKMKRCSSVNSVLVDYEIHVLNRKFRKFLFLRDDKKWKYFYFKGQRQCSLRPSIIEFIFFFGLFHCSWVISFIGKSTLLLYTFYPFYFIHLLLNSFKTIFLKSCAQKTCIYYKKTEWVLYFF